MTHLGQFFGPWRAHRFRHWRLRLDVDEELVWFCPECDWREFGGDD
jgi:hypothetical protein